MANFAFIYTPSNDWVGGKNYYLSLFSQLNQDLDSNTDSVFVFTGVNTDINELKSFNKFKIVKTKLLNDSGFFNLVYRIVNKYFAENLLLSVVLKKYKIDILSHSYIPKITNIKCLPWIPDFQHCFLPDYFSEKEIIKRNKYFKKYLNNDNFLLSSYSALKDAESFFNIGGKASVYRFLPTATNGFDRSGYEQLCQKYNLNVPFVFLPNQFWRHKNHMLAIKACKLANERGKAFTLVCSGGFSDYRHPDYQNEVESYIDQNQLRHLVIRVGLVDRLVFNCLLAEASVLINPSKFEGWSTTVEEGKAVGKPLALSNLAVHIEQTQHTENVRYFDVDDTEQCLVVIQKLLLNATNNSGLIETPDTTVDQFYKILKVLI
tara:strand:- start:5179 stop:6306 length:1128 start_codon:yes stop_codon:yes gene_type:complete